MNTRHPFKRIHEAGRSAGAIVRRSEKAFTMVEIAIALGELRRQGYAITAVINTYEDDDFAHAAGPLLAYGIPTRHLKDEAAVVEVCRQYVLR